MGVLASAGLVPANYQAVNPTSDYWYNPIGQQSLTGLRVTADNAMRLSAVWGCVRVISEMLSSIPIIVYERISDDERRRATGYYLYDVLGNQPNRQQTSIDFRSMMTKFALLRGNGFAEIKAGRRGFADQLIPLHPSRVTVEQYRNGAWYSDTIMDGSPMRYKVRRLDGTEDTLPDDRVFHFRGMTEGGIRGMDTSDYAKESIGLSMAGEQYAARYFSQNAAPPFALIHPGKLPREVQKRMREQFIEDHAGLHNMGAPAVFEDGMKLETYGMTNQDAQMLESRGYQVADFARFFGVPLHLLQLNEKSTCLPADTLIFTDRGPRRIADMMVGDQVWSLNTGGQFVLSRVWRAERTGNDPILRISTRGRVLRANAKHRVLVRRKQADPQSGCGGYRKVKWVNSWVPASDLAVGDYIVGLRELPNNAVDHAPNGRSLTVGFMAVAGLLVGDGTITSATVSVARHHEAPYMDAYREIITREFQACVKGAAKPASERAHVPVVVREYERCSTFSSIEAAAELRELGFSGTAHTKRVPEWVFGLRHDLIIAFLSGYLDADGAANEHGWVTFSSASPSLLEDVRHLCMMVGLPVGRVRRYQMRGEVELNGRLVHRGDMYQLFLYHVLSNRMLQPNHPRKRAFLENAEISQRVGRYDALYEGRGASTASRPGTEFAIPGAYIAQIKAIEVDAAEDVYDLGVEGTHTFVADGIVVHNSWGSGIEEMMLEFVIGTLMPWAVRWDQAVSRDLITDTSRYYTEHLFDALVRGNLKGRYDAYAVGRNWGFLSVNDIRRRENMNIVDGGDDYALPPNTATSSTPPESRPAPEPQRPQRAQANGHYVLLLQETALRVIRKEIAAMSKAAKRCADDPEGWKAAIEEFYADHAAYVSQTLRMPLKLAQDYVGTQRLRLQISGVAAMEDWETRRVADLVAMAMEVDSDD